MRGAVAEYVIGSGTSLLHLRFIAGEEDYTGDLDYADAYSLAVAPGALLLRDASDGSEPGEASQPANLTMPLNGGVGSLGINGHVVIDPTPPSIVALTTLSTPHALPPRARPPLPPRARSSQALVFFTCSYS